MLPGARDSVWMAFARTMATAVACLWLVTGAVRAMVGHLVDVMGEPLPSPDVLRTVTALNYVLLGLSGMAALGLMILGVSVAVLRGRTFPRWFGWFGVGCSALVLGAVLASYGAYASPVGILWSLVWAWRSGEPLRRLGDVGDDRAQGREQRSGVHGEGDAVRAHRRSRWCRRCSRRRSPAMPSGCPAG